jgi:hypothetical protein
LEIDRIPDPIPSGWLAGVRMTLVHHHRLRQLILKWKAFLDANTTSTPDPYLDSENQTSRKVEFWRAIIADSVRRPSGTSTRPDAKFMDVIPQCFSGDTRPYTWEYWSRPSREHAKEIRTFYEIFSTELMRAASWRSLILSETGYIGLAPTDAKPGDVICVIRGYHMPVVLRPVEAKKASTG